MVKGEGGAFQGFFSYVKAVAYLSINFAKFALCEN